MIRLVIATRNAHKAGEIRAVLGNQHLYSTLNDLPEAPPVIEDAATFAGNATKKAVQLAHWYSEFGAATEQETTATYVLADDSGLEVDALGGAPGVHSARFAGLDKGAAGNSPDAENNAKLLRLLGSVTEAQRTARFRCVLALTPVLTGCGETASPVCAADSFELQTELYEGACEGRIGFTPMGSGGFGYDPLFVPDGGELTFAELGEAVKNRLSHRAKALEKLKLRLGPA